jgi:glycosyltransferase involved in cell wall biosynthesis
MNRQLQLFARLNAPYYIYAPAFNVNSGGIRAMHQLCHALNLAGEEAYVTTTTISPRLRTPPLTPADVERHRAGNREAIVVYPEVVKDNPINARHVVRYLLNIPGFLSQEAYQWGADDLLYTIATAIVPEGMKAQMLQLPLVDTGIYNRDGVDDTKRSGNLLFINRYLSRGGQLSPITEGFTEISFRAGQRTPEQLAALYRSAQFLYTYEPSTACYEAQLCGCPVVYLPNDVMLNTPVPDYLGTSGLAWGNSPEQLDHARRTIDRVPAFYEELNQTFLRELEAFIDCTQARVRETASVPAPVVPVDNGIKANKGPVKKRVLLFSTETADAAAPFARIVKPLSYAPENWKVEWGVKDGRLRLDATNRPDLIVFQRAIAATLPLDALKQLFGQGIPVVYDTDERFDISAERRETAAEAQQRKACVEYVLRHAHAVTVANEQLAAAYRSLSSRVHVVADQVAFELFESPVRGAASTVHIGVAGRSLESSNFALVHKALRETGGRYGDRIKLTFLGDTPPAGWGGAGGASFVKTAPTLAERAGQLRELGLDLAIVPLASTPFNESASASPYLEFSAAGIATIASDREPYRALVRNGDDGVLVGDKGQDWVDAIGKLIEAPALRRQLALTAQAKVLRWHRLRELPASLHSALLAALGEKIAPAEAAASGPEIVRGVLILDPQGRADEIDKTFDYIDSTPHKDLIRIVLTTQQAGLPEWTTKLRYLKAANAKEYEAAAAQLIALPTYDWALVADAGTTRARI